MAVLAIVVLSTPARADRFGASSMLTPTAGQGRGLVEVSPTAEPRPFATPVQAEVVGPEAHFHWSTTRPPLEARYRLEWTFRA